MNTQHRHKLDSRQVVYGDLIVPGMVLSKTDVEATIRGTWERISSAIVGETVQCKLGAVFVRPA